MKIVFYDGYCPMCNAWVRAILRWDKKKLFHFAPLQSDMARRTLQPLMPDFEKQDTLVFFNEDRVYVRSDAALKVAALLPAPFSWLAIGQLFPRFLRDGVYRWVARNRFRIHKKLDECPLPPPEWRERFIME
jgi:predicted DCC family thiol-disulfide oxidoreductase YuxK